MNTHLIARILESLVCIILIFSLLTPVRIAQSSGYSGYSLNMDGVDDYVDFGTNPVFEFGTGDFTLELWVNYSDLTGEQILIEKFTGNLGPGWTLTKMWNNTIRFATNEWDQIDGTPPTLSINTW